MDAVVGGLLGAFTAAGMALFVCQFVKGYCEKATLGPLPWLGYVSRLEALRRTYLGETNAGAGPRVGLFVAVVGLLLVLLVLVLGNISADGPNLDSVRWSFQQDLRLWKETLAVKLEVEQTRS